MSKELEASYKFTKSQLARLELLEKQNAELIARLEAAQNSDEHNFQRWQACQEKLEAAETSANRYRLLLTLFSARIKECYSDYEALMQP